MAHPDPPEATMKFLRDLLGITALTQKVDQMAKLTQDQIDGYAGALDQLGTRLTDGIAGVAQDVADLKAQNPDIDTTSLDVSVAKVNAAADALTSLDAENPVVPPADETPVDPNA